MIRCAKFSQGFLNRHIVILLHCIGVPSQFFLSAQKRAIEMYTPERVRQNLEQVKAVLSNLQGNRDNVFAQKRIDFDPQELRGPMKDLLFAFMKGRNI